MIEGTKQTLNWEEESITLFQVNSNEWRIPCGPQGTDRQGTHLAELGRVHRWGHRASAHCFCAVGPAGLDGACGPQILLHIAMTWEDLKTPAVQAVPHTSSVRMSGDISGF